MNNFSFPCCQARKSMGDAFILAEEVLLEKFIYQKRKSFRAPLAAIAISHYTVVSPSWEKQK